MAYQKILELASAPKALGKSADYLASRLQQFLKARDRVLICFPAERPCDLGSILEQAVVRAGGIPVFPGPDQRWITLLRKAFDSRASALVGPPKVMLGLAKLARITGTPLNVRNIVAAGYPCPRWVIDGIMKGLDCRAWGCYGPGAEALVAGFSCAHSPGIHLREDEYSARIADGMGKTVSKGEMGEVYISPVSRPDLEFATGELGKLIGEPCLCGQKSDRIVDISTGADGDPALTNLDERLHSWSSVLDCRLNRGESGLELELVVFPGEKLPKLPLCAKRVIRAWNPEQDVPFCLEPAWKNAVF